jgi:hypothetical protein
MPCVRRRATRPAMAVVISALIGCGGDGGVTQPPPGEAPIARIEFTTDTALVFTASAASVRALIAHVYDSSGASVPNPALTIVPPAGWEVRGDTVIVPSAESRGQLQVTARRSASARGVALETVGDGVTDSVTVTASVDLRAHTWRATWSCSYAGQGNGRPMTDESVFIDSLTYDQLAVDSVTYPGDAAWVRNFGGVAQLHLQGRLIRWRADGVVDTVQAAPHQEIAAQAPDTLMLSTGYNNPERGVDEWPALKISDAPLRYVGGTWCPSETRPEGRGTVTFEETVAP